MLTQRTAHGVSAMLVANVLGRVAGLAAQIITGFALLDTEFGIYAMAIGITTVAGLFRGGEIQNYLVSLPPARRRFRTGSAFWLAEIFTLSGVIPTLVLAPTLARWLEQPGIVPIRSGSREWRPDYTRYPGLGEGMSQSITHRC